MREPTSIAPSRFFDFVRRSELAVVFVSAHPLHVVNRELCRRLASEYEDLAIGTMPLKALLGSGSAVLRFLHQGLRHCGAPAAFGALPGYHLFWHGEMLAWDAGLPGMPDVTALARSALLGAVWSGISSDLTFIRQALLVAADQTAAERLILRFHAAIANARAEDTRREDARRREAPGATSPPEDELYWAYQVLGVVPTATDREVHDAWRRRRAATHPDLAGGDPIEFERRSRFARDINRARDIIRNHRHPGTSGGTQAWAS